MQEPDKTAEPASVDFRDLLAAAHMFADRSAIATLAHFRQQIEVADKSKNGLFDPVTAADREAECAITGLLTERFPNHGVVGEEFGERNPGARYTWVIDPVDGTRAFIMGTPMWGTLIGLLEHGRPILGMMDQPFTRERFWSADEGSVMRGPGGTVQPLNTRRCARLEDAVLTTTHPDLFGTGAEADCFSRLKAKARMTRYGGDCYSYAMLAAGHVDLVVEAGLQTYDIVALIPIIERAGGVVTTWGGLPATSGGRIVAAGDPVLHAAALEILAGSA